MRAWAFLSLLVVVSSAPLDGQNAEPEGKQDNEKVNLVKRAQEIMMFGNQQNEANTKDKRSDLTGPEDNTIDKQGSIVAEAPVDIGPEESSIEETTDTEEGVPSLEGLPVDGNMVNDPVISEEDGIPLKDGDDEEESEVDDGEEPEVGEQVKDGSDADDTSDAEMYDKFMNRFDQDDGNYLMGLLDNQYGRLGPSYPSPYSLYDYLNAGRYRRSRVPKIHANPKSRVLKRARRIKRDLYFTSDILGRKYNPYGESPYLNTPYENDEPEMDEDDIRYLINLLADSEGGYQDDGFTGYDDDQMPYSEYLEPELDTGDSEYYVPKRQAGLTFVPGIKRSREFFPYFREPQSHFSAFVPQKRSKEDYAEAYQRLMELAAELRAEPYYPENEYEFEGWESRR